MSLLDKCERKLGRFSLPNVTLYIIAGQVIFYFLWVAKRIELEVILLIADTLHGPIADHYQHGKVSDDHDDVDYLQSKHEHSYNSTFAVF